MELLNILIEVAGPTTGQGLAGLGAGAAAIGAGIGVGTIKALEAMARQPESTDDLCNMILLPLL